MIKKDEPQQRRLGFRISEPMYQKLVNRVGKRGISPALRAMVWKFVGGGAE